MKKTSKFTSMRTMKLFLFFILMSVNLTGQWAVADVENNFPLIATEIEGTNNWKPLTQETPAAEEGTGGCDGDLLIRLQEDLALPNGVGKRLQAFFDSKPAGEGVKAWEIADRIRSYNRFFTYRPDISKENR